MGSSIRVLLDGAEVMTATDGDYTAGGMFFGMLTGGPANGFHVDTLEIENDPGTPTNNRVALLLSMHVRRFF